MHKKELFILSNLHQSDCCCTSEVEEVKELFFEHLHFLVCDGPWILLALSKELPFSEDSEDFPGNERLSD